MKIALIILGVLVTLFGLAFIAAGAALLVVAGTDGWAQSPTERIDTTTYAMVSESAEIETDAANAAEAIGDIRLRFRAEATDGTEAVFIGIGSTADVDRYLNDVEHDVITDIEFDDFEVEKEIIPGEETPTAPGDQDFWAVSSSGDGQREVDWKIEEGSYRVVVMNEDGSRGVDVRASAGVRIPHVLAISLTLMIGGGIVLAAGMAGVLLAASSAGRAIRQPAPAPPPPPPAASPPPPDHTPDA